MTTKKEIWKKPETHGAELINWYVAFIDREIEQGQGFHDDKVRLKQYEMLSHEAKYMMVYETIRALENSKNITGIY